MWEIALESDVGTNRPPGWVALSTLITELRFLISEVVIAITILQN